MFDESYWEQRWQNDETGWDIGQASTPLTSYFDGIQDKEVKILIPGCGNAWEGQYLHDLGFKNVYLMDLAPTALSKFKARVPNFPKKNLLLGDFFALEDQFDIIIEQTFFCALHPSQRAAYAENSASLLYPNGLIVGLLFENDFGKSTPPFGGHRSEYLNYFKPYFHIQHCEIADNSIKPRAGKELFIEFKKR